MFDDGPVMSLIDVALIGCTVIAVVFLIVYMVHTRWERGVIGWLIVGNTTGWLLVCVGGILYRAGAPESAQWFFLPLAVAVPSVLVAWLAALIRARRSGSTVDTLIEAWQREGWLLAGQTGRQGEAAIAFRHADELAAIRVARQP